VTLDINKTPTGGMKCSRTVLEDMSLRNNDVEVNSKKKGAVTSEDISI